MTALNLAQLQQDPLIQILQQYQPVFWFPSETNSLQQGLQAVGLARSDIEDAERRLQRFAPFIAQVLPETQNQQGMIESELVHIPRIQQQLSLQWNIPLQGQWWLKKDSHLPISGSIKARGGIYEVLAHAETLALNAGLISVEENYRKFDSDEFRTFFQKYQIAVGSTGNLGLSIGIMSAKLGFRVSVHMSADAGQWKKDKLRSLGVNVVEYASDYGVAVEQGRKLAQTDPNCFFIDDENSKTLFLGYAVAGLRLKHQLIENHQAVDAEHPLFVYLPCGVGGGPGGVSFGLKHAFGEHVHCIFAEPTHSPCMLLGVYTGLHDQICVNDIGLDNLTAADGLAVGRASGFVGRAMQGLIDGYYTISDQSLYDFISQLDQSEQIRLEPSAAAGFGGAYYTAAQISYQQLHQFTPLQLANATHVVWATGGGMVPEDEMQKYLQQAKNTKELN
ncbi:D-serine ammonia-lyase [Acinetobacter sp. S40]|uniref:D-serine ammonia-lyase n=1 Tax=Acinetobacter sp. S40 TaxID=2767434 RepID=UPI00190D6E0C|nr:D-serine ammonia-lyase [Acinetobacter sp. S40]MBJ9985418.1 D-serine ammonia-lyase [Acinetobacter sp. S40]